VDDAVAAQICELRSLRALELGFCSITDAGLGIIATLPELRRLSFSGSTISDAGIKHFSHHPRLEHVELRTAGLTDQSLEHLSQIKTLTRLDLYGSGQPGVDAGRSFTSSGLAHLKALPNLRTLWLNNFPLVGGSAVLKDLPQLRELTMMMCDVTDAELDALVEARPNMRVSHMTGGGFWTPKRVSP
jgi:Leucine-rich repeat (LRR) protein